MLSVTQHTLISLLAKSCEWWLCYERTHICCSRASIYLLHCSSSSRHFSTVKWLVVFKRKWVQKSVAFNWQKKQWGKTWIMRKIWCVSCYELRTYHHSEMNPTRSSKSQIESLWLDAIWGFNHVAHPSVCFHTFWISFSSLRIYLAGIFFSISPEKFNRKSTSLSTLTHVLLGFNV